VSYRVRLLECGSNCDDSPHRLREQSDRTGDVTNDTCDQVSDAAHARFRRHSTKPGPSQEAASARMPELRPDGPPELGVAGRARQEHQGLFKATGHREPPSIHAIAPHTAASSFGSLAQADIESRVMRRKLRALALAVLISLAMVSIVGGARAADTATADEAFERLQIGPEQRRALVRGDVISYAVGERGERELAVGLAVFIPAALATLSEYLVGGELIARDATIAAHGLISDPANPTTFPGIEYTRRERQEADGLLEAAPGTHFNLAPAELDAFRALRATPPGSGSGPLEKVSDEYRRLFRDRTQAYQRGGLAAILPYARSGNALTDPAAELRLALPDAEHVPRLGRQLRDALSRYPAAQPANALHHFYWVKRRVQRRPDLSLLHQMVIADPDLVVHVERYFYVGHSYNAAQIITGAFAYREGAVLFATSRFSTDEILGIGHQLKRSVGRAQLRDEMRKRVEGVRASLSRAPTASPQMP
jgi:hypothetical protein